MLPLNAPLDCEMLEVPTPNPISQIEGAMATVTHLPKKGYRTIRVPLADSEYDRFLSDRAYAKARLDELCEDFPDVFPEAFPWGYALYGFTEPSIKQEIRCRRIRLDQGQTVFAIAPAFVMPYMTGRTHEIDHALFLMRFHVPYWALAHVFGHDAMYWYRKPRQHIRYTSAEVTRPYSAPKLGANATRPWRLTDSNTSGKIKPCPASGAWANCS